MQTNYWQKFTNNRVSRRRLLKSGAALSLGATALGLVGCGGDEDSGGGSAATSTPGGGGSGSPSAATPTASASSNPVRGGTYGNYFASVGSYNIAVFYHDGFNNSGITAYDRPMTATLDGKGYVLEAAASAELPEPTQLVLKLKPGMVYQDMEPANGRAVKASDIAAYQEYVKQLPNAQNSAFQRLYMDKVEAPDDETVVFTLTSPFAYLLTSNFICSATEQAIVPAELIDVLDEHPAVGSGPYQLTDHIFGSQYNYERFEKWRDADKRAWFNKQHIVALTDPIAQETAFRGGEISEWQPDGSAVDRLLSELDESKYSNVNFLATGLGGFNAMMNFELGGPRPWQDIRFREAIYRLTNAQQWVDLALDGKGIVPVGPLQAALSAYQLEAADTEPFFKEDVAAAKQLLSAMEYDTSQSWEIVSSSTSPVNAQMAEIWQNQLARADVKVTVTPLPLAEMLPNHISNGMFDLTVGGQPGGDTPFRALRVNHSDTTYLFSNVGLYDADIDAMIEKSEQTIDRDENIQLVKQIQTEVLKRYTMSYNTYAQQTYKFYDAKLQNFDPDPLDGQTYHVDMWFEA